MIQRRLILFLIVFPIYCFGKGENKIGAQVDSLLEKKDYKSAEELINKAISADSTNGDLYMYLGVVQFRSKNLKGSLNSYNQALEFKPNNIRFLLGRGIVKKELKDYKGAMKDFDRSIFIVPLYIDGLYERAMLNKELGNYEEALLDLNKLALISSKKFNSKFQIAIIKKRQGKLNESLADYSALCIEFPKKAVAWNNLADTEMLLNDFDCALEHVEKSIGLDSTYATAFLTRGEIRLKLQRNELACQDFNKAKELGDESTKTKVQKYLVNCKGTNFSH